MKKLFNDKHIHETKHQTTLRVPHNVEFSQMAIQVHGMKHFTDKDKEKFMAAMLIGEKVLNSWDFKFEVCSADYTENRGMESDQIWKLLCTGNDLYSAEKDHDIDVFVTMYHNFWTGVIGYTFPNTFKTWINNVFFQKMNEAEIFGNVLHEAMHNLGFDHKDYENKHDSVPYKIGHIGRDIAKQYMKGKKLTDIPGTK